MKENEDQPEEVIQLKPKSVYGMRMDVVGQVFFNTSDEIIYPVEGLLAVRDTAKNSYRFVRFPDGVKPVMITSSHNRKWLAIIEELGKNWTLNLYDSVTLKKRRVLPIPEPAKKNGINKIKFNLDARAICILSNPPDETFYMLYLDKDASKISYSFPPSTKKSVETFCFNPYERNSLAISGDKTLYMFQRSEKTLSLTNQQKLTFTPTTMIFLQGDILLFGTKQNEMYLMDNSEIKYKQPASEAEAFDLLWDQEALNSELENRNPGSANLTDKKVVNLQTHQKGFLYAIFNKVFVFDKVSKFRYERRAVITLPIGVFAEELYQVAQMSLSHKEETIAIVANHPQIYVSQFLPSDQSKTHYLEFKTLGVYWHGGEIVALSICAWKPIIMTASKDQTVRIWNYANDDVELIRKFQVDVHLVELSPTGFMAAIGFTDQLRITQIFLDELNIVKTYNFSQCAAVRYSSYGHLMAAAYDNKIAIASVYSLKVLWTLKAHNGTVLSLAWDKTDSYIYSGGAEGAIYQWDVLTGKRVKEIVLKGTEYTSFCFTRTDNPRLYASTQYGTIREFADCELVREVTVPAKVKCRLTDMTMLRSGKLLFAANGNGEILFAEVPLMEGTVKFQEARFFVSAINRCVVSYDGAFIIVISKMGTMVIFCIENVESKLIPIDSNLLKATEIMIPRHSLVEKNEQITNLTLRLKQQAAEFQYQISQATMFDNQQLANVHRSYCQALEELRNKNNEIEQRHTEELNNITLTINDMKDKHRKLLETLTNQYSERMLIEYQKYTKLRDSMIELQESYEEKLKKSAGDLQDTVEGLENDYKKQLDERNVLIRELMKEMQDKKVEFIEYCRGVEAEYNHSIDEMNLYYENKLTTQRNESKLWRGKSGVLQKRYETLLEEVERYLDETDFLKEEQVKSNAAIAKIVRQTEEIQREIADRDYAINAKERRIQEQLRKNQELDKLKQVLAHKISDMKAQIEPIEFDINDKRKRVAELEFDLSNINLDNISLEKQLSELKEKYLNNVKELVMERNQAKSARHCIEILYADIYAVTGKIHLVDSLREAVEGLFAKHANDEELRRFINTEEQVRDEFMRQRTHIETIVEKQKKKSEKTAAQELCVKVFNENHQMMKEIEKLNVENERLHGKKL